MAFQEYANRDTYNGSIRNEKRHGEGTYTWASSGNVYTGAFVDNARTGEGTYTWASSGDVYTGVFVDGARTGEGTYTWASGDVYTGAFVDGARTGEGTYTFGGNSSWSGDVYTGAFVDGNHHGIGTFTWANGDVYTGAWVDNYRTGEGTFTWTNGDVYTGAFVDGSRTGEGTFTWTNGDVYTGAFVNGASTGEGTYTWASSGDVYTGTFVDGARTGEGTFTWANGDGYTGAFVNGVASGGLSAGKIPYYVGTATVEKLKTDISTTDAILFDTPKAWASNKTYDNGTSTTITYSFAGTSVLYLFEDGYDVPDPKVDLIFAMSTSQQAAVRLALDQFSNVADLTFVEVQETALEVGTLRFGFTDYVMGENAVAWADTPGNYAEAGDIWITSNDIDKTFERGSDYTFATLIHEIGHALGLDHPFEGNDQLPTSQDFSNYTLMSYTDPENYYYYDTSGNYNYLISSTPMVYDIAAIQHLYGAATYNAGDTVYKYDPAKPFVEAIWDSGGYDTLDLSSFNKACTINLTPGAYSTIACTDWTMTDNLGIAAGAIIEQAIGGSGSDTITGNFADNTLYGGAGNDVISAGDGDDIIYCGTGNDTLTGGLGADEFRFYSGDGSNTITDFDVARDTCSFYQLSGDKITSENITVSTNNSGEVKYSLIDGTNVTLKGIFEIPEAKDFAVSSIVSTRDGSKIADVDVVMSDGTNSSSHTSAADGSVSGSLTSGSAFTVIGSLAYSNSIKAVSSQDALDALKLSVGMTTAAGTTTAFDYIAADFNQDGKVSSQDALAILKYSVGLTTQQDAKWVFVDTAGDYSDISKLNTSYTEGVSIDDFTADMTVGLTGILIGDVNDSYSGLIA
ncbi:M10 family metallopeptidase C-terminal domain-containing protein [Planktomarina temperata]|nr:M10 family metallopeptidase C-terminal domain-containing protein [Planktomarina temperata]